MDSENNSETTGLEFTRSARSFRRLFLLIFYRTAVNRHRCKYGYQRMTVAINHDWTEGVFDIKNKFVADWPIEEMKADGNLESGKKSSNPS